MKRMLIFIALINSILLGCSIQQTTLTPSMHTLWSTVSVKSTTTPTLSSEATKTSTPRILAQVIDNAATTDATVNWRVCDGAKTPNLKNDLSPNKEWLMVNCDPNPPIGITTTKIFRLDGSSSWDISFYEVFGKTVEIDNGKMNIIYWSNDGNYVYLTPYFCCLDVPENIFFNYFQNSIAIYSLDLRTGKTTTILQPFLDNLFSGYAVSFSSTGKYLAYVHSDNPTGIYLYNIQTGKAKPIRLNEQYNASGLFAWSPDDKKLVFVAVKQGWNDYDTQIQDGVSYFLLDIETGSLEYLFDKRVIYKPNWTTEGKLILTQLLDSNLLLYDFQSSSFSVITPTPYK